MNDAKLPDLNRLKDIEERLKKLPSQKSASDTSNWDGRDAFTYKPLTDDEEVVNYYVNLLDNMDNKKRKAILAEVKELQTKHTHEEIVQMVEAKRRNKKPSN